MMIDKAIQLVDYSRDTLSENVIFIAPRVCFVLIIESYQEEELVCTRSSIFILLEVCIVKSMSVLADYMGFQWIAIRTRITAIKILEFWG
jgi:hypothetical protein